MYGIGNKDECDIENGLSFHLASTIHKDLVDRWFMGIISDGLLSGRQTRFGIIQVGWHAFEMVGNTVLLVYVWAVIRLKYNVKYNAIGFYWYTIQYIFSNIKFDLYFVFVFALLYAISRYDIPRHIYIELYNGETQNMDTSPVHVYCFSDINDIDVWSRMKREFSFVMAHIIYQHTTLYLTKCMFGIHQDNTECICINCDRVKKKVNCGKRCTLCNWMEDNLGCCNTGYSSETHLHPLRAKFFRENINIYLHFVSYLHIDMTQVAEILPQIGQGLTYST